ncbi:MAG: proprotein convertase P-domain-containing protein, partial [Bacteroidota bacterium]
MLESTLLFSDPPVDADGFINACPGQEIRLMGGMNIPSDFTRVNSVEFAWYFGDGEKANTLEAIHSYEQAGGYKLQLTLIDPTTGCTNINDLDLRVRVSPKPQFEFAEELNQDICVKDTVQLSIAVADSLNNASILVRPDTSTFLPNVTRADSLALPDGVGNSYISNIFFDGFEPNSTFQNPNDLRSICVNMEHSWARDLKISLRCPNGEEVILHNFEGRDNVTHIRLGIPESNDNIYPEPGIGYDYCWTPLSTQGTWIGYTDEQLMGNLEPFDLPSGSYNPYEGFEEFIGCPLNGQWALEVEDLWARDNGYIFSWQLNFNPQLYAINDHFSPAIIDFEWLNQDDLVFYSRDSIAATPSNAGLNAFDFKITDEYGCVFDTIATIPILPFSHPDCYDCFSREKPFELIADTTICRGDTLQLGTGIEAFQDTIRFVNMESYTQLGYTLHPPATPYASEMKVEGIFPELLSSASDEIIQICIDVVADSTEFISDYDIQLEAPSGEQLQLVAFQLFTEVGNELRQTCFTPVATQSINNGTPPFTGDFSPMGDWNTLDGATKNGVWKLVIADRLSGFQQTTLKDWSITFTSQNTVNYSWSAASGLSCTD